MKLQHEVRSVVGVHIVIASNKENY